MKLYKINFAKCQIIKGSVCNTKHFGLYQSVENTFMTKSCKHRLYNQVCVRKRSLLTVECKVDWKGRTLKNDTSISGNTAISLD